MRWSLSQLFGWHGDLWVELSHDFPKLCNVTLLAAVAEIEMLVRNSRGQQENSTP